MPGAATAERPSGTEARRALSAPERKARRRRILQWVLPALAVLVIAGTFGVAQLLMADGLGQPRDARPDEVSARNTTQFGPAGIEYAERHQRVTVNLSELPIAAADVSLADDASATIAPRYGFLDAVLWRGQGGGIDGEGYDRQFLSSITATTEAGRLVSLEASRAPTGWAEFPALIAAIRQASDAFGWGIDEAAIEALTDRVGEHVRAGQPASIPLATGDAMGLPVTGSVQCDETGLCVLETVFDTR